MDPQSSRLRAPRSNKTLDPQKYQHHPVENGEEKVTPLSQVSPVKFHRSSRSWQKTRAHLDGHRLAMALHVAQQATDAHDGRKMLKTVGYGFYWIIINHDDYDW